MIFLRSLLFNLFYFGSTAVLMAPGLLMRLLCPARLAGFARFWARLELGAARVICGIRLQVLDAERLPSGAALIASRHESAFDTMVWLILVPRAAYVLKTELLRLPVFGGLLRPAGMIPVDRYGGSGAVRGLMRAGAHAAAAGRQIVIFPEGTRAEPGTILPLHPGVAALATATGLDVLPVVTDSGDCWGRRSFRKRPGTVRIALLAPIPAGLGRERLMRRLAADLAAGMDTLRPRGGG